MNVYYLENEVLKIAISTKGAELQSLYNKETQLEYLWSGDAAFWGKKSPVLFPIVGGLKNNEYHFQNKTYQLSRHGFARDNEYEVTQIDNTKISFRLKNGENTLNCYPFYFNFLIEYSIENNKLSCQYFIENTGTNSMYFSVGAHPAFNIPLTNYTVFNDWFLELDATENCGIHSINEAGLIETTAIPFLENTNKILLSKELFYKDALIFKQLQSTQIKIKSNLTNNGLNMQFKEFPYFGIWAAKDANFVCLEPWCGIGDSENTTGNFVEKEGIEMLYPQQSFERTWSIEMY